MRAIVGHEHAPFGAQLPLNAARRNVWTMTEARGRADGRKEEVFACQPNREPTFNRFTLCNCDAASERGDMTRDDTRNITRPVTVGLVVFSLAVFVPSDAQERASRAGNPAQTASYTVVADVERPVGLAFGPSGDLYVAQPQAGKVTRVKPDGTRITLLQGLKEPRDPAFDFSGNLYVAETETGRILKLMGKH